MLKTTYPALITPTERGFRIEVPQFDITVEAEAAADGIQMARNQICTVLSSCVDTRGGASCSGTTRGPGSRIHHNADRC